MIADHTAWEITAGQHNLEEGDYSLFFWVAEYPSEERYLRVSEYYEVIWQGLTTWKCVLSANHTNGRAYASVLRQSVCHL